VKAEKKASKDDEEKSDDKSKADKK
jgi:hypothetical protein